MFMRGTTCLIYLLMLLAVGCREGSSKKNPAVTTSKTKEKAVVEDTPEQPPAKAAWSPPANPDPHVILREAKADTQAGRYEEALAKHVWFHSHALEIEPALYGVRLS